MEVCGEGGTLQRKGLITPEIPTVWLQEKVEKRACCGRAVGSDMAWSWAGVQIRCGHGSERCGGRTPSPSWIGRRPATLRIRLKNGRSRRRSPIQPSVLDGPRLCPSQHAIFRDSMLVQDVSGAETAVCCRCPLLPWA